MSAASSSSRCLYSLETFEGWRGILWLPNRVGCRNLQGLRAGLCTRGARPRSMIFRSDISSQWVTSRTVPGDPIRKRVFRSHELPFKIRRERDWVSPPPNALVQYTPKKVPLVHLLAHRAIVFLVAYGRLLPVDALHLFGERDPAGRHVFECGFLMDGSFACVARSLGLLFVDTCPPVATYKANTGQTSPFQHRTA
jgi:hypothetical protein